MKKRPSDYLEQLVLSMSRQEIRYFRIECKRQGEKAQYEHLFEAILKAGNSYDEKQARAGLAVRQLIPESNFPMAKQYLEKALLRALRHYSEDHTIDNKIQRLFEEGKLLTDRRLYQAGIKKFEKACKLAMDYERFAILTDILERLIVDEVRYFHHSEGPEEYLMERYREKNRAMVLLQRQSEYQQLLHQAFLLLQTKSKNQGDEAYAEQLDKLSQHPLLMDTSRATTFHAQLYLYHAKSIVASLMNKDPHESLGYFRRIMELWSDYPLMKGYRPEMNIIYTGNYLTKAFECQDYQHFKQYITEVEGLNPRSVHDKMVQKRIVYLYKLVYYLNSLQLEAGMHLAEEVEATIDALWAENSTFGVRNDMLMFYNMALIYFFAEQFDEALRLVKKIMDKYRQSPVRPDIRLFMWVFRQALYFELGEFDVLANTQPYAENKLKNNERFTAFEEKMISHFRELGKNPPDRKELVALFQAFLQDLEAFGTKYHHIVGKKELIIWAKSRISGQSMAEVFKDIMQPLS